MATKLKAGYGIVRETSLIEKGRPVLARITAEGVYLKPKGLREKSEYFVPWGTIFTQGAWRKAEEIKRERQEKRANRKAGL
jgi:hypothetical protein